VESATRNGNHEDDHEDNGRQRRRHFNENGVVCFEGDSEIDGAPIVMITTGIHRGSSNRKTSFMLQTWVLRSDIPPSDARRLGADRSICGDCPLREGACYVTLHHGPRAVFEAYRSGSYRTINDVGLRWASRRAIRFGSYGDPAAVPARIWFELAARAESWTGYTHEWRAQRHRSLRRLLMASVETPADALLAQSMGWRSFRIRLPNEAPLPYESVCPASHEGGERTTCFDCRQCDGARPYDLRRHYTVIAHGAGRSAYRRLRLPVVE
jgi:hypothetical protein